MNVFKKQLFFKHIVYCIAIVLSMFTYSIVFTAIILVTRSYFYATATISLIFAIVASRLVMIIKIVHTHIIFYISFSFNFNNHAVYFIILIFNYLLVMVKYSLSTSTLSFSPACSSFEPNFIANLSIKACMHFINSIMLTLLLYPYYVEFKEPHSNVASSHSTISSFDALS